MGTLVGPNVDCIIGCRDDVGSDGCTIGMCVGAYDGIRLNTSISNGMGVL